MTTEHKNIYEELIEKMMIEGITGMTDELRLALETSTTEEKRSKILLCIEENSEARMKMFSQILKTVRENRVSSTKHIKNVVKMLRDYVEYGDVEVKSYGEVMTPITLVEEMLDTLPDNVWTNPDLKWLDPCNGVGIFISIIVQRLMKGLVNVISDEELRYKHIMENQIYVCELQPKNMFLFLFAFDPEDRYALNIHCGSYLSEDFNVRMAEYGVDKFDVVVMNPPYQELKEGNTKSQAIWDKFIIKALEISLVADGYLVAVHPSGWRSTDGAFKYVQSLLKSHQMLYLEVHSKKEGIKMFGASTPYDFYCVRNTENQGNFNTKIKCQDGTIERVDISKMEFIPNGMYDAFQKLIPKKGEETVKILYSRSAYGNDKPHMSKEQTEEFKYPCVYYTYKNGSTKLFYSNTNKNGHFGIPKLIWSQGISMPIIDANGEYGVMNFACSIIDNIQNLERIKQAMLNPEFIKLMSYSNGISGQRYDNKAIALFRKDFWIDFLG